MHCSNLGAEALAGAIKDYEEKKYGKPESSEKKAQNTKPKSYITCENCDAQNPVTASFCMGCGEKLKS
jgi:hypothetical protein